MRMSITWRKSELTLALLCREILLLYIGPLARQKVFQIFGS